MKMKMLPFVSDAAAKESAVTAHHLCRWVVITVCLWSPHSLELAFTARGLFFLIELQSKTCMTLAVIINLKNKKSTPKKNLVLNSKSSERLWKWLVVALWWSPLQTQTSTGWGTTQLSHRCPTGQRKWRGEHKQRSLLSLVICTHPKQNATSFLVRSSDIFCRKGERCERVGGLFLLCLPFAESPNALILSEVSCSTSMWSVHQFNTSSLNHHLRLLAVPWLTSSACSPWVCACVLNGEFSEEWGNHVWFTTASNSVCDVLHKFRSSVWKRALTI